METIIPWISLQGDLHKDGGYKEAGNEDKYVSSGRIATLLPIISVSGFLQFALCALCQSCK